MLLYSKERGYFTHLKWIEMNYNDYTYAINSEIKSCFQKNLTTDLRTCSQISYSGIKEEIIIYFQYKIHFKRYTCPFYKGCLTRHASNYYYYTYEFKQIEKYISPKDLTSWTEAEKLCRDAGGTLPYFFSRDELYEFLTMIKFSGDIFPLIAIYIGLVLVEYSDLQGWQVRETYINV